MAIIVKTMISKTRPSFCRDQSGIVIVIIAILLPVLLGFAALAIDVGRLMVVRNELQNAADAAALSGAVTLSEDHDSDGPPWTHAEDAAATNAPANRVDGVAIAATDCTVESGYWDLENGAAGLQGEEPTGGQIARAVRVTVRKNINHWFAPVIGIRNSEVVANATAISANPGTAMEGALLPLVINQALADRMEYHQTVGTQFRITNGTRTDGIEASLWTTFFQTNNGNKYTKDLLDGSEESPEISIGDVIQVNPGVRNIDYQLTRQYWEGRDVLLPVVETIDGNSAQPVVGFIGFHIDDVYVRGANSYILGHFVPGFYQGGAVGNMGPNYGVYMRPSLVE